MHSDASSGGGGVRCEDPTQKRPSHSRIKIARKTPVGTPCWSEAIPKIKATIHKRIAPECPVTIESLALEYNRVGKMNVPKKRKSFTAESHTSHEHTHPHNKHFEHFLQNKHYFHSFPQIVTI
jgi:hypothetical protein